MPHFFRHLSVILVILFATLNLVSAEPSATTRYLTTEKVSLLDYGLHRLEDYLLHSFGPHINLSALYVIDTNQLTILVSNRPLKKFKNKVDSKSWSLDAICKIRQALNIDCSNLKTFPPAEPSRLKDFFSHAGFRLKDEQTNIGPILDKMTHIKIVTYYLKENKSDSGEISCETPLIGSELKWTE